ncbi:hypothetical protein NM208_g11594 [Fusarium decemcellulare]|uniref:Uncharacterized protein n=1 Tax=Fusarium decemcellulare TaxID=57161 RepID=A0ACC1RRY9_9HYPO|nr:hypothetical protein NM208_g11594 [Fusarium decemcellulare]
MAAPDLVADLNGFMSDFNARKGIQPTRDIPTLDAEFPSYYAPELMFSDQGSAVPSARSTNRSTMSRSTYTSSCFDRSRTWASNSVSTAPSHRGPFPLRHQPATFPTASLLVCEFVGFGGCGAVFSPEDEEGWIAHIANQHLGNIFPRVCVCWFCNEPAFRSVSKSLADREACYRERMHHIASHFRSGRTRDDIRPDFFFLDHVHDHRLITEEMFQRATQYHETPQIPNLYPAGWRPSHQSRGHRASVDVETSRPRHRGSTRSRAHPGYHS